MVGISSNKNWIAFQLTCYQHIRLRLPTNLVGHLLFVSYILQCHNKAFKVWKVVWAQCSFSIQVDKKEHTKFQAHSMFYPPIMYLALWLMLHIKIILWPIIYTWITFWLLEGTLGARLKEYQSSYDIITVITSFQKKKLFLLRIV